MSHSALCYSYMGATNQVGPHPSAYASSYLSPRSVDVGRDLVLEWIFDPVSSVAAPVNNISITCDRTFSRNYLHRFQELKYD